MSEALARQEQTCTRRLRWNIAAVEMVVAGTGVPGRTHQRKIVSHQGQYGSEIATQGTSVP